MVESAVNDSRLPCSTFPFPCKRKLPCEHGNYRILGNYRVSRSVYGNGKCVHGKFTGARYHSNEHGNGTHSWTKTRLNCRFLRPHKKNSIATLNIFICNVEIYYSTYFTLYSEEMQYFLRTCVLGLEKMTDPNIFDKNLGPTVSLRKVQCLNVHTRIWIYRASRVQRERLYVAVLSMFLAI